MRELTVPRLHAVCVATLRRQSAASAKTVRTILSGVCGLAVRYGALSSNPVRDVGRLEGRRKPSRALSADELRDLLGKLDADPIAVRHDLPDLARWYAGTGERTGEALAVHWHHVDLDTATVTWAGGVIRVKGHGQMINAGKTEVSPRTLRLPMWVVDMLRERRVMLAERYGVDPAEVDGVATLLDGAGLTAREIADQLRHSKVPRRKAGK